MAQMQQMKDALQTQVELLTGGQQCGHRSPYPRSVEDEFEEPYIEPPLRRQCYV